MRVKQIIKKTIRKILHPVVTSILNEEFDKYMVISEQMSEYANASDDMLASKVEKQTNIADLLVKLKEHGVPIIEETINIL